MKPLLTDADFERAARRLKCGVAAIKAVAEVESRGQGFYKDGFPVILFERHKFREFTQGRYNRSHPHLSGPAGNYGAAGQNQRNKFNQAFGLNPIAAMKSCSWGKFQIMGFNYKDCGFNDVGQFVDAMKESEGRQLDAFVAFVIANRLDDELRNLEWAKFARGYNGPTYKKKNYDTKMARAYAKYVKTSAAPQTLSETPANTPSVITDNTPPDGTLPNTVEVTHQETTGTETLTIAGKNEQSVKETVKQQGPEPYNGIGFWATIKRDLGVATGGNLSFSGLSEYAQQATGWPEWLVALLGKLAVGALIATIGYFIFRTVHYFVDRWQQNERTKLMAMIQTDINRKNIEFK